MLFWRTPSNEEIKFELRRIPGFKHFHDEKTYCRINFVDEGIALTRSDTKSVHLFDWVNIKGLSNANDLIKLWYTERTRLTGVDHSSSIPLSAPPPTLGPGRPLLKFNHINAHTYGHVFENDSIYLLESYLNEKYPNGGILCCGEEVYYTLIEEKVTNYSFVFFLKEFKECIASPRFANYPMLGEHQDWLTNSRMTRYYVENIKLLRPVRRLTRKELPT